MCMRPQMGEMAALAKEAEALGYAALLAAETGHEPFMPLALAAEHTERLQLGTCVAVALSRSPVHLAHAGHDLQRFSRSKINRLPRATAGFTTSAFDGYGLRYHLLARPTP